MEILSTPMAHQNKTVEYLEKNPYAIGALDIGTGKTLVPIIMAVKHKLKTLIVCPTYLVKNWINEINKHSEGVRVSVLLHERDYYPLWDTDICIITYSFVHKAELLFSWADQVHFDEAHYLKTMGNIRTEGSHKLIYEWSPGTVGLLSGTPLENRVYELYSLMSLCYYNPRFKTTPDFLKKFPTHIEFAMQFSHLKEFEVWNPKLKTAVTTQKWWGYKNLDELKQYLEGIYIRFKIDDVMELPEAVDIDVVVDYKDDPELLEALKQYQSEGELNGISSAVKKKAAVATAPFSAEYSKNMIDQGILTLVFSDHIESSQIIAKKLGTESIDSQMDVKRRDILITEFQEGKRDFLVGTSGVLGTGHNLQRAQDEVQNDLPWKPTVLDQIRGRIRRKGATGAKCRYHNIIGTIQYQKIKSLLQEKEEMIKAVL